MTCAPGWACVWAVLPADMTRSRQRRHVSELRSDWQAAPHGLRRQAEREWEPGTLASESGRLIRWRGRHVAEADTLPSPTLSPTDPVPRGLLTLCPEREAELSGCATPRLRSQRVCRPPPPPPPFLLLLLLYRKATKRLQSSYKAVTEQIQQGMRRLEQVCVQSKSAASCKLAR